jgi:putative ABC transport system permease protein
MRSLLTTLGIIVGVISIISVMAIGEGAKQSVRTQIEGIGSNFIIVLAGSAKRLATNRGGSANLTLNQKDLKTILQECDDIEFASPGLQRTVKSIYENNNWQGPGTGVNENYLNARNWNLTQGRFLINQDIATAKKLVVIGKTIQKELFENIEPLGKTMRIKNIPFKIILCFILKLLRIKTEQ